MKLILLAGDDCFEITDVNLKDGIIPCLSGISYSGKDWFILSCKLAQRVAFVPVVVIATVEMCRVHNHKYRLGM